MEKEKDQLAKEIVDKEIQIILNKQNQYSVRYGRTGHHG